jgi:hypothetical protein
MAWAGLWTTDPAQVSRPAGARVATHCAPRLRRCSSVCAFGPQSASRSTWRSGFNLTTRTGPVRPRPSSVSQASAPHCARPGSA